MPGRVREKGMFEIQVVTAAVNGAGCGAALMCAGVLELRRPREPAYRALAVFFLVMAVILAINVWTAVDPGSLVVASLLQAPLQPLLPVLFWFYVDDISAADRRVWGWRDLWHLLPGAIMLGASQATLLLPAEQRAAVLAGHVVVHSARLAQILLDLASALWIVQASAYMAAVLIRLRWLNTTLREYFGSTEARELSWLRLITVIIAASWSLTVAYNTFAPPMAALEIALGAAGLATVLALGLWATRQRPALQFAESSPERVGREAGDATTYARSQLDDDHLTRIAERIEQAFSVEQLYRDPALSLDDLAKAIGVRAPYLSQTFSRRLHSSFFEYCAAARITEACALLRDTDRTVTQIAADVGFNSRSAFYSAFRAAKRLTPTAYRQQQ
jgi:AraC-like DNA-binding protein